MKVCFVITVSLLIYSVTAKPVDNENDIDPNAGDSGITEAVITESIPEVTDVPQPEEPTDVQTEKNESQPEDTITTEAEAGEPTTELPNDTTPEEKETSESVTQDSDVEKITTNETEPQDSKTEDTTIPEANVESETEESTPNDQTTDESIAETTETTETVTEEPKPEETNTTEAETEESATELPNDTTPEEEATTETVTQEPKPEETTQHIPETNEPVVFIGVGEELTGGFKEGYHTIQIANNMVGDSYLHCWGRSHPQGTQLNVGGKGYTLPLQQVYKFAIKAEDFVNGEFWCDVGSEYPSGQYIPVYGAHSMKRSSNYYSLGTEGKFYCKDNNGYHYIRRF